MKAENIHARVDDDGHDVKILDTIVDYRKDSNAFDKDEMFLAPRVGSNAFVTQPLASLS